MTVNAFAGCGKTSTIVNYCKKRLDKTFLYFAYNNEMAKEAKQKFKFLPFVKVVTFHSLAYEKFGKSKKDRLDNIRAIDLVSMFSQFGDNYQYVYAAIFVKYLKEFCNSMYDFDDFINFMKSKEEEYNSEFNFANTKFIIKNFKNLWDELLENENMKLEHDIYLKEYHLSQPELKYDYILVDEAQDINSLIIDLVLSQKAKKIFIGDDFQQIYGWRGATSSLSILEQLEDRNKVLYLSQSFRCPKIIAKYANLYLKLLGAKVDFVGTLSSGEAKSTQKAIIARSNGSIFDFCVNNIEKKFYFKGGIDSYNFQDLIDLLNLQALKHEYIKSPFIKKFQSINALLEYAEYTKEIDLETKILTMRKNLKNNIFEVIKKIKANTVTKIEQADFILMTGHKSKGLEFENVKVINDFVNLDKMLEKELKRRKKDKEDTQNFKIEVKKEEINLLYVAITRSMKKLDIAEQYLLSDEWISENKKYFIFT